MRWFRYVLANESFVSIEKLVLFFEQWDTLVEEASRKILYSLKALQQHIQTNYLNSITFWDKIYHLNE